MPPVISQRIRAVQKMMRTRGVDGFLVTSIKNVRYLSGFTGSSGFLLVTKSGAFFLTDFRYQEQAEKQVVSAEIIIERGKRLSLIRELLRKHKIARLGFESSVSFALYQQLGECGAGLVPLKELIERLRVVKDAEEVKSIAMAVTRAEGAYRAVRRWIRPGVREVEVARRLESALWDQGCRHAAFEIIVASGANASMPHAQPSQKKIAPGDCVLVDWGGESDGYYSDMSRTVLVPGASDPLIKRIYDVVNRARHEAIKSIRVGMKTQEIDAIARNIIRNAGFGDHFGHSLGHGIGLDVHEYPYVSWTKGERVRNGMVFSIEPGIYVPRIGGVRIEDVVLVRDNTVSVLTNLSREAEEGGAA